MTENVRIGEVASNEVRSICINKKRNVTGRN